jgi:hypothetical protein
MEELFVYVLGPLFITFLLGLYFFLKSKSEIFSGKIKTYIGNNKILLGGNLFSECKNILEVDNELIISVDYPEKRFLLWKWRTLILNLKLYDQENKIIAEIKNNEWILNKNNFFKKEIQKNRIKIIDQNNKVACDVVANKDGSIVIKGIFYINGKKIEATENELILPGNNVLRGCQISNCGGGIKIN